MAERMSHNLVSHPRLMPGVHEPTQTFISARSLKDGLHPSVLTTDFA